MNTNPYRSPTTVTEENRQPVTVKAYGLFPMTRRTYLLIQVVMTALFLAVIFGARLILVPLGIPFGSFINDHFLTIILVTLSLEGIETLIMLSKFKKALRIRERAQRNVIQVHPTSAYLSAGCFGYRVFN